MRPRDSCPVLLGSVPTGLADLMLAKCVLGQPVGTPRRDKLLFVFASSPSREYDTRTAPFPVVNSGFGLERHWTLPAVCRGQMNLPI